MEIRPLVVVPAFNEQETIGVVVREINELGFDCVVVDDASEDETALNAKKAGAFVIRLCVNSGVGGALRCGFRWALKHGYESVIQVDGDGQHRTEFIPQLIQKRTDSGADLVIGSRFASGQQISTTSYFRRLIMRIMAKKVSQHSKSELTDVTSGFRLISNPLLGHLAEHLPSYYLGDTFECAFVAARRGYLVTEVPVEMRARIHGRSSVSINGAVSLIVKALFITNLGLHFDIPHRKT
jgi:glycosyltransferase involved in cell wall biosynthesis